MEKQNITKKVEEKNELSSKERHNIILKLYKGLTDNLEELNKSKDKRDLMLHRLHTKLIELHQVFKLH